MQPKMPYRLLAILPLIPPLLLPGTGALLSFAIVIAAVAFLREARRETLRFAPQGWPATFALGIGGGLVLAGVSYVADAVIMWLTGEPIDLTAFDPIIGNLGNYLVLLAVGIGVGGVLEELTFRGFVIGFGRSVFGERSAVWLVVFSAAVFGVAHLYQGLSGVLSTGLMGLLLGLLYLYAKRSVLVAMLAHATMNVVGITLIYLGMGG